MKHTSKANDSYFDNIIVLAIYTFRDGRSLTDSELVGMLIGLLLAGQHTSSTTSAWLGFFLARDKVLQVHL